MGHWPAFLPGCSVPFSDCHFSSSATRPSWRNGLWRPTDFYAFLLGSPWPIGWAYWLLGLVAVVGLLIARPRGPGAPWWLIALPLVWLCWQFVAATQTVDAELTKPTLEHFVACAVCFYLSLFSLSRVRYLAPFWLGLLGGVLIVVVVGWEQHFGGLEDTRRYFFAYVYPRLKGGLHLSISRRCPVLGFSRRSSMPIPLRGLSSCCYRPCSLRWHRCAGA